MRRSIDNRTLFTYTSIGAIGLFLLMLVSASLNWPVSLPFFATFAAGVPLLIIVTAMFYMVGRSERSIPSYKHTSIMRLAVGALAGTILSVVITYLSTKQPAFAYHTLRYIFENIGVGLLFLAGACTLLLINGQRFIYWPFWNASDQKHSDERQKAVRQRVFEKAYRYNILVLLVAGLLYNSHSQRLTDELIQVILLCLLGMPSIIAGLQKDS